jgi:hypothetical protein
MNRFRRHSTRFLNRIELIFVGLVVLTIVIVAAVQMIWIDPAKACEAAGNWWDPQTRICGQVVYLPNITHRPIGSKAPLYPNLPKTREQAAAGASDLAIAPAKTR